MSDLYMDAHLLWPENDPQRNEDKVLDQAAYYAQSRESRFDAFNITKIADLMSTNELLCQNANKLTAQGMVDELKGEIASIEALIPNLPASWPDVCTHLARIRGYGFLGFRICSAFASQSRPKPQSHPAPITKSIDDLL